MQHLMPPTLRAHPLRTAVMLALAGMSTAAFAQTAPDAGQILQEQRKTDSRMPERLPQMEGEPSLRPALKSTGGVRVQVKSLQFSGHTGLATDAELQALLADAVGQQLDMGQLQQLADRVTQHLKAKGWLLARAYLPQQDVTDGTIEISIVRGRIEGGIDGEGLRLDTKLSRLDKKVVKETLKQALFSDGDDAMHTLKLERALLLLNDLPGISARSTIEKGDVAGTSRLAVEVDEGPLVTGSVAADNYGNRYTGSDRLTAQLSVNDPLGIGDQVTLMAATAARLNQAVVGYSLPLGHDGLRAGISHTALRYRIGEELAANESRGEAATTSLNLSYPFIRRRDQNLRGQLGYETKSLKDETLGVVQKDRRIENFIVGLSGDSHDQLGGGGLSNFSVVGTHGDADLSRVSSDVTGDATARTAGKFSKLNYSLARLQKITDQYSLFGSFSGQTASKNLVSSEKFMLGGPNGVRAYPSSEGSGDEGMLATMEVRYDPSERFAGGNLQFTGFVDAGHISLNKRPWSGSPGNATDRNSYSLAGAGVGVNYTQLGYYTLRAMWATKLGDNPGRAAVSNNDSNGRRDNSRFWLQALIWF